jgi:hypothetical protein
MRGISVRRGTSLVKTDERRSTVFCIEGKRPAHMFWGTIRKKQDAVMENNIISVYVQLWKVKEELSVGSHVTD